MKILRNLFLLSYEMKWLKWVNDYSIPINIETIKKLVKDGYVVAGGGGGVYCSIAYV